MTRLTLLPHLAGLTIAIGSVGVLAGPELRKVDILDVIKDAKPDIDACATGMKEDVIKTRFTITPTGDVKDVKIEGKHGKDAVGTCIKQRLTALRFGPSLKATPVTFPFRLGEPRSDDTESAAADTKATGAGKATKTAAAGGRQLDRKEVKDLLKVLQSNMGNCGTGVVSTHFTIQPDGAVRQVKIDGDHAADQVGMCVTTKLSHARFPAAPAATPVSYPFRLE